jgi:hypothetical protein
MLQRVPEPFRRDEWAYLISFTGARTLETFTASLPAACRPVQSVAVWLPNNVSLLGPLMTIALSLTGARVRLKSGSRSRDLAGAFLEFARAHAPRPLASWLEQVEHRQVPASDPWSAGMAAGADVRIAFGSDESVAAIDRLPHPPSSIGIAFVDRTSEAWIFPGADMERTAADLVRVFAVYGKLGCTSPARVVLPGGTREDAETLRRMMLEVCPTLVRNRPEPSVASETFMASQWASALGWDAAGGRARDNAALLAIGDLSLVPFTASMALPIIPAPVEAAIASLPPRIQSIGHAGAESFDWSPVVRASGVKRIVPLIAMHHFGPVWDAIPWFRLCFEEIDVQG